MPDAVLLTVAGLQLPLIPLVDAEGSAGTEAPEQMARALPKVNKGVTLGVMVTVSVAGSAHCPAAGVKVYVPEFWLSIDAWLHVPVMPLVEVLGNDGTAALAQMESDAPKVNVGVMLGLTVTVKFTGSAQVPAAGVKV